MVAELLPRNKFVTMEWLVWKKYPLDQEHSPLWGRGGKVNGKVGRARYLGKILGCLCFSLKEQPQIEFCLVCNLIKRVETGVNVSS